MAHPIEIILVGVAALQDLLFAVVVGTWLCDAALRSASGSSRDAARLRLRGSVKHSMPGVWLPSARGLALAALALAHVVLLWLQAATMTAMPLTQGYRAVPAVLDASYFGRAWLLAFAGIVVAAATARGRSVFLRALFVIGLALYAAGKAGAGHASDAGALSLREVVQWAHIGATASWAGIAIVGAIVLARFSIGTRDELARHLSFCERLSRIATFALAVVVATGLYNAVSVAAHAGVPLLGTAYGWLLTTKISLVALAALLGAANRSAQLPMLRNARRDQVTGRTDADAQPYGAVARRFDTVMRVEAGLMAMILALAAMLAYTSPTGS
jgi:putative copper resistance protein D